MASALQCPACGHKHRLTELSGDPVFSCEQCGRLLKTPVEYRRPESSAPAEAPRPNGNRRVPRGGSAARDQTSVFPAASAPAAASAAAAGGGAALRAPRSSRRPPAQLGIPLLVLGWVIAVILGGVIVRYFAKATGLVTGDSVIDILTGTGWGRYLRVFALVPFWALATAGLMTLFVEGGRRWAASRGTSAGRPPKRTMKPVPAAEPRPADSPPRTAKIPSAAETRSPSGAASAPRARRIPKRDISS